MAKVLSNERSSEEKVLAGLAYLFGFFPALIIWALKKDESHYVGFHAVQAAVYDGFVILIAIFLLSVQLLATSLLGLGVWIGTNMIADWIAPENPMPFLIITIIFLIIFLLITSFFAGLILILKIIDLAAVLRVFLGQNWQIPVLAKLAEGIANA